MGTESGKRILEKMLDRLLAAIANGPSLNARPHNSRQRVDLTMLGRLRDREPDAILRDLLGEARKSRIVATARPPAGNSADDEGKLPPEAAAALRAWSDQNSVLSKLRTIVEDARDYENDTGVHALYIGFPLLSLPPGSVAHRGFSRRVLAPVAYIALDLAVCPGTSPSVTLECRNDGAELVQPNIAAMTWLSRLTGNSLNEILEDESGVQPWDEIAAITAEVCRVVGMPVPPLFTDGQTLEHGMLLTPAPRADEDDEQAKIIPAAVLGLYPMANQGLIRDTQALIDGEPYSGPIESFLKVDASLEPAPSLSEDEQDQPSLHLQRKIEEERMVAAADPCQVRAVMLARSSRGLVVHGPPGTGKSQTITNIIGDHLARGERVLFVSDKRTALDVVMNRLDALGLGELCAVVHDPRRDQRELYKSIREQLDKLSNATTDAAAESQLARVDRELVSLHQRISEVHRSLMCRPTPVDASFHELVGKWLAFESSVVQMPRQLLDGVTLELVEMNAALLAAMLERAGHCGYLNNPWRRAAGMPLDEFLATSMAEIRQKMADVCQSAAEVDALQSPVPLPLDTPLDQLAASRQEICDRLARLKLTTTLQTIAQWMTLSPVEIAQRQQEMELIAQQAALLSSSPVDLELAATVPAPPLSELQLRIAELDEYLQMMRSWRRIFAFRQKKAVAAALRSAGLPLGPENASRLLEHYRGVRVRILLVEAFRRGAGWDPGTQAGDGALLHQAQLMQELLQLREMVGQDQPALEAIVAARNVDELIDSLRVSAERARALLQFLQVAEGSRLFAGNYLKDLDRETRQGSSLSQGMQALEGQLHHLEAVLRTSHDITRLPAELRPAGGWLLKQQCSSEEAMLALRRDVVAATIAWRLKESPHLQVLDSTQLARMLERYTQLEAKKQLLTREAVRHRWIERQKQRLLTATGSRLHSSGAELRRRLMLRGANALRLRQVIAAGARIEGGDPLFDLRPVWMASPETVAQVFPRESMFDVAVFDEASQCRLEEALPVLLRARRVVIAGDPKQLPPSRFFESSIASSEDEEIESDQQLFEVQQGEIEDLLTAALNLEIEEAYLDVHYRSRNADLIEFSNQHFYSSRLQPIPGHPANRPRQSPLTLHHVGGTYEDRRNVKEAKKVCEIVRDLLRRKNAPSIGIACFSLQQREAILDALDKLAQEDHAFASDLAEARNLRREGMFEGLFVKNLENVQGDERDHIIISTTYGPDPQGRFYKRFGPLGRSGGGRRLNVLITRAREEVHLVSSIPQSVYRNPPEPAEGQSPGGPLLLFYYLAYAEHLASEYQRMREEPAAPAPTVPQELRIRTTRYPSEVAKQLARQLLAKSNIGSWVHWGNDGFCVDLALQHPHSAEDVTIGVLCDLNRFESAADAVEWEIFRTNILAGQGWKLLRLWTPHFFRDPDGCLKAIAEAAAKHSRR